MKGNALLGMTHTSGGCLDIEDVLPSIFPRLVATYQKKEIKHEKTHKPRTSIPQIVRLQKLSCLMLLNMMMCGRLAVDLH